MQTVDLSTAAAFGAGAVCALLPSLLIAARQRRAAHLVAPARPEFVLFGDSITQQSFAPGGWGAVVGNAYQRTADIRLRGYSGYNTRWALELLPRVFPAGPEHPTPALVTILLGANDANLPPPLKGQSVEASRQYVPIDEYIANLQAIVDAARAAGRGGARVLLVTPPPCDEDTWHNFCVSNYNVPRDAAPNRAFAFTKSYADAVVRLGKETGTPTLDLHAAFEARRDWQSLFRDGLHPNPEGGTFIGTAILGAIASHFPDLRPGQFDEREALKLPLDFPDHKEINTADVPRSFTLHRQQSEQRMRALHSSRANES